MDIFLESQKYYNVPLIDSQFTPQAHLIYVKYTSDKYFKYSSELFSILCKNSLSDKPKYLFQLSISFYIKILYNCGNSPCLNDLDLLILCSFLLGTKISENQHKCLTITKIKNIYPEKFSKYSNEEVNFGEIICIKTLQYNINILTPYECLLFILRSNNNLPLFNIANNVLEKFFFNKDFLFNTPMQLAKNCLKQIKKQIVIKKPIFFTKKNISIQSTIILHSSKANESISTGTSSFISNANININNKQNIKQRGLIAHKKFLLSNKIRYKNFSKDKFHITKNNSNDYFYNKYYEIKNNNIVNQSINNSNKKLNTINLSKKFEKPRVNSSVNLNNNFISIDNIDKNLYKKPIKKLDIEGYDNNKLINTLSYNDIKNKNKQNNKNIKNKINLLSSINFSENLGSLAQSSNITLSNSPDYTKSTIIQNTNRCLNLMKRLKLNINKNQNQKKIISIWRCEKNKFLNFNYDKISDLCSKLNFDLITSINNEAKEDK